MSINKPYDPVNEPYYRFFKKNGYVYLDHGYMHVIFEKDGLIYKVLRSSFGVDRDKNRFQFEADMLKFVKECKIPCADVVRIYKAGELIPDYCVLVERKLNGKTYLSDELKPEHVCAMFSVINTMHDINMDFFGPISTKELQVKTWREYMDYMLSKAKEIQKIVGIDFDIKSIEDYFIYQYTYDDKARFLLLDPNEKNYIFDDDDKLQGVIDIDHPIAFDPLYDFASFLYSRPKTFALMQGLIDGKDIEIIKKYAIIYALFDLWFRYEKNNHVFDKRLDFYITKAKMFLTNSKETL